MLESFYQDKKVLITGATGFKGAWLSLWLTTLGAKVYAYSLVPPTYPSLWHAVGLAQDVSWEEGDINDGQHLQTYLAQVRPEIIFHLAAQALVGESFRDPVTTMQTNVVGTLQVLEAARAAGKVKVFLNVTSDKCYAPGETGTSYPGAATPPFFVETDPLGAADIYAASKAAAEILATAYRLTYLMPEDRAARAPFILASARAGNVIGGGDWALERLIPDVMRAIQEDRPLVLRRPQAIRPWQHVLDALSGYLLLAAKLYTQEVPADVGAYNFGPDQEEDVTVAAAVQLFLQYYGQVPPHFTVAVGAACFRENPVLRLSSGKAKKELGWHPVWPLKKALAATAAWYRYGQQNPSAAQLYAFSQDQIKEYMEAAVWPKFGAF